MNTKDHRRQRAQTVHGCPHGFTTKPITDDNNWVRLPKPGDHLCGFTRSHLYALYTEGVIRSVSIRRPHHKRGIRLLYRPSILDFIAKLDAEQNGKAAKNARK